MYFIHARTVSNPAQVELASKYLTSLRHLGQKSTTIFLPQNAGDVAGMVTHATGIVQALMSSAPKQQ